MYSAIVTGGAGFIGSNLVDKLIDLNWEVTVIDNESAESNEKFYWNEKAKNFKYDICNYNLIRPLFNQIDFVFHLAAEARIQVTIENPISAIQSNVLGTCVILQCAKEANVKKVIYSSTSSAYGLNPIPNIETQPDNCLNPYSVSKVSGEKLCTIYTKLNGLKTIIFRYFNVYGNRQPLKGQYSPVIGKFLKQRDEGLPLTIVGDGEQKRDFTNILDVIEANVMAAIADIDNNYYGTIFNVGCGKNYTINEIANLISSQQISIPPRVGESRETLANVEKIKSVLNWSAKIDLKDWLNNI